ncbi:MAG: bifunctional diaminohydroxyphosphoribosylaminopyrimidine deaminase/5-amino-6-(5-phosphoribosylamino)uracil reductase RibD [Verrucomicrobiae bacterium]|nr:bifunctional diaminohydroxyphosphoribosylaminopyrimidine deaminase/5-amino-6-(5-phosphoribosylamino)uracil reductase RibD [Verrucomicrobiae bacterium]
MRLALRLARRGYGRTSPNPMVGAVLVKRGQIIGRGWHRKAGGPHAEIEALQDAQERGHNPRGATLYVTLEPCCTHGRTPPCTRAILAAGIRRVVVGALDPNPRHAGRGLRVLQRAGVEVTWWSQAADTLPTGARGQSSHQKIARDCTRLNEAFNHWIVRHTPFVTVKAAMTLDGKIATASGESKWITGETARAYGMRLRQGSDAILVGINTILQDDPSLTVRRSMAGRSIRRPASNGGPPRLRRIILDSMARTPLTASVVTDDLARLTTIVVGRRAPQSRVAALAKRVNVLVAPLARSATRNRPTIDLPWLLKRLGAERVTSLLVEGGGEVNAAFLLGGYAQRVAFFYAPKILGGREARKAVAGAGAQRLADLMQLRDMEWRRLGKDLLLLARIKPE